MFIDNDFENECVLSRFYERSTTFSLIKTLFFLNLTHSLFVLSVFVI